MRRGGGRGEERGEGAGRQTEMMKHRERDCEAESTGRPWPVE